MYGLWENKTILYSGTNIHTSFPPFEEKPYSVISRYFEKRSQFLTNKEKGESGEVMSWKGGSNSQVPNILHSPW